MDSSRQRRKVARVNYAEVSEEGEEAQGGGGVAGAGDSSGGRGANRRPGRGGQPGGQVKNRPLRLKDEFKRGGKEEEDLQEEVRAFRGRVRAVVKGFSGEAFAVHFREPVDLVAYPNYLLAVAEPMDLSTILFKLRSGAYDSHEVGGGFVG